MALHAPSVGSFRRERPDPVPRLARWPRSEHVEALQEYRGGLVVRPGSQARGEGRARLVPRPAAVGSQTLREAVARRRVDLARAAEDLEDALRLAPAGDADRVDLAQLDGVPRQPCRLLADQRAGAVDLVRALEPRGEIHRVAHDGVALGDVRADVADEDLAGGDPDADADRWQAVLDADQLGERRRQGWKLRELVERRQAGQLGLRLAGDEGRPPERHHRVADVLVDDAVVATDRLRHRR